MTENARAQYDVFVSHASADRAWVEDWLLPRLEQANLRVCVGFRDFVVGKPEIENIQHAVAHSYRSLVVVTPAWLASELNVFEAQLLRYDDPLAQRRKLLPLILKPCDLPEIFTKPKLTSADFTNQKKWEQQFTRVRRDVEDVIPVPFPRGWDWSAWRRWVRRYRREIRRYTIALTALGVLILMLGQQGPFAPRLGWSAVDLRDDLGHTAQDAFRILRVDDALVVGAASDFANDCKKVADLPGLWRSENGGQTWKAVTATLEFKLPGQTCTIAAIKSFAATGRRVYAATSDVGLLRSDNAGASWDAVGVGQVPEQLKLVAVSPSNPDLVFVAVTGGSLWRSTDGGNRWTRVDTAGACPGAAGRALPENFLVNAMLMTDAGLYVGSGATERPPSYAGLYYSRDDGACWQRQHDGMQRYRYLALAHAPNPQNEIVMLTQDLRAPYDAKPYHVWRIENGAPSNPIGEFSQTVSGLYVDGNAQPRWYVADFFGKVYYNYVRGAGTPDTLAPVNLCFACLLYFAQDPRAPADVPLVLMNSRIVFASNRVLRYQIVPWYRALLP
ncbi:MAG: TIR domain-containing protein [Chloroflexi bacterium]|nr:TIR domain-containing protein [Chloroflexota bacterium]